MNSARALPSVGSGWAPQSTSVERRLEGLCRNRLRASLIHWSTGLCRAGQTARCFYSLNGPEHG
jgi:hypothetical protein